MILNGWSRPRSRGPQIAGGRVPFKKRGLPTARDSFDLKKTGCCLPPKGFPLKRTRHKRCAMRFPKKVCKMNGVQLAPLKGEALSTACNSLPPKRLRCRRPAISFPQKVFAVDGLQSASLKKFLLSMAYNWLPLKSKGCRRPAMGLPQKVSTVDGLQQPSGTGEKWVARRRRASRKVIWPEPARRCGKWRGRPWGDGGQCGARRSS